LTSQKNHKFLIHAFSLYVKKHPECILFILGEGALYSELLSQVESLSMTKNIRLLGSRRDIHNFYSIADVFVSTSIIEGLSIAYLEALSFGVPIVATKTAGTDEILISAVNGVFIEPTIYDFEKGIDLACTQLEALKRGALDSSKKFSIQQNVKRYEELIISSIQSSLPH
jgi:glycosyltransferase involved in cell wall biosynthesis